MPELPEVETVRSGLEPAVSGAVIMSAVVYDERALTRHRGSAAEFEAELSGRRIIGAARRGKFLWLPLEDDDAPRALVGHLGMSGKLLLRTPAARAHRHERIRLRIEHPDHGEKAILFADQRTFGSLAIDDLVATTDGAPGGWGTDAALVPTQVAHIARDALDPVFDEERFRALLSRKRSAIKRVLLDQTVISGIGNIYADEALWASRIHPETPANTLSDAQVWSLLAEVRIVLERSLARRGTSFDAQYLDVDGRRGSFHRSLNAYGRGGKPCKRCGLRMVRVSFMNRSSHFCPGCQQEP